MDESIEVIHKEIKKKIEQSIYAYSEDLKIIRTDKASVSLLDHIKVEVYDQHLSINQIATLSVPEVKIILIEPWDKQNIKIIEKAILKSDLNLNPTNDGQIIRLVMPSLTQKHREDLIKKLKQRSEKAKVSIRNSRREANDKLKNLQKKGLIDKDNFQQFLEKIQNMTDDFIKKINKITQNKENNLLKI